MEQNHVENISTLIHFMDGLNDPRFNMNFFLHSCDTPACALGWACTVPALQKAGLSMRQLDTGISGTALKMTEHVFGEVFSALFRAGLATSVKTPQDWANHAREFLKSQGHEVVAQSNEQRADFRVFMDRVLKPVTVTA